MNFWEQIKHFIHGCEPGESYGYGWVQLKKKQVLKRKQEVFVCRICKEPFIKKFRVPAIKEKKDQEKTSIDKSCHLI